jgi:monoamine oxidase
MPRNQILSAFRNLAATFRRDELLGIDAHESLARSRDVAAPSRRDVLKGAVAGAAVYAMPDLPRPLGGSTARIAVVGAGLAGLVAATKLRQMGHVAEIFEASSRAGGRVLTDHVTFAAADQRVERGGELIDTGHKRMQRLAREFGLALEDLPASEPAGTQMLGYFGGSIYTFAQAQQDFAGLYQALRRDISRAKYPTTYNQFTAAGAQLDQMSVDAWIQSRVPGGLASQLGQLLSVAYDIEYGALSSDQSALNLLYLLGYGSTPNNFALFGSSDERFRVRGGNDQITTMLAEPLELQIQRGHRLVAAATMADGRTRLTFATAGGPFEAVFDRVVMTVPFAVLRADVDITQLALSPRKRTAILQQGMGTNAKLHALFSSRHWHTLGSNGETFGDTGFQNTWEETRAQGGTTGILVNYLGSRGTTLAGLTPAQAVANFLTQLEPALPGLSSRYQGVASIDYWPGSPNQRGSYSHWRVGQYTAFAGVEREAEGTVHFAGEHTSVDFQGYMEGAVESGERAAAEVLAVV